MGMSAVTGNGIASLIHHVSIQASTATVDHASLLIPSGEGINQIRQKKTGPKMSGMRFDKDIPYTYTEKKKKDSEEIFILITKTPLSKDICDYF